MNSPGLVARVHITWRMGICCRKVLKKTMVGAPLPKRVSTRVSCSMYPRMNILPPSSIDVVVAQTIAHFCAAHQSAAAAVGGSGDCV